MKSPGKSQNLTRQKKQKRTFWDTAFQRFTTPEETGPQGAPASSVHKLKYSIHRPISRGKRGTGKSGKIGGGNRGVQSNQQPSRQNFLEPYNWLITLWQMGKQGGRDWQVGPALQLDHHCLFLRGSCSGGSSHQVSCFPGSASVSPWRPETRVTAATLNIASQLPLCLGVSKKTHPDIPENIYLPLFSDPTVWNCVF